MKKIGAKSTSGPEAIILAVLSWWFHGSVATDSGTMSFRRVLLSSVSDSIHKIPDSIIKSKSDLKLGEMVDEHMDKRFSIDALVDGFWEHSRSDLTAKYMMELATVSYKAETTERKIKWAKDFIRRSIIIELGILAKEAVSHNIHEL